MILRQSVFFFAASAQLVILRASDEDARRISTSTMVTEFPSLPGCKPEDNP
jgi:hypothetical protein